MNWLQENVVNYSLEVERSQLKSTNDFIVGYPVGYTTRANFIGVVHLGWGHKFIAQFRVQPKWYNSWRNVGSAMYIDPTLSYSAALDGHVAAHQREIVIYPYHYEEGINYRIIYSADLYSGSSSKKQEKNSFKLMINNGLMLFLLCFFLSYIILA